MSLGRAFTEEYIPAGDGESRVLAMKIACAECGAVAYFAHQTGKSRKPPVAAKQNFQAKGWVVGSGPRKDFCPVHAALASRKGRAEMPANDIEAPARKADAPREITREERGIIFAKIGDVYGSDRYVTPWTDQKVADDLGVPRAWVSDVREQFYGPEGSNPLYDQLLTENVELQRERAAMAKERKVALELIRKGTEAAQKICRRCDDLDSKARDIAALAKRIEREIGR